MQDNLRETLEKSKIIVIVRGVDAEHIVPLAEAMYRGGIRFVEVTFDASGRCRDQETAEKIRRLCDALGDRMYFGAGTVLTEKQLLLAKDAGARYIISPDTNTALIRKTKELGMLSMPGALTPSEIVTAHNAGADYVKLFPTGEFGVSYFKAVTAPLNHIKLLAVGGVSLDNMASYLAAGAYGFGIGSSIVDKKRIAAGDYAGNTQLAASYVQCLYDALAKEKSHD
ncbi:MAG: bifunctional 4-hydroxy-2-oxoglutarate aldolase/2-dehydro-3-deoxy-phosphogluconate aldolase [Eubacteriales bacterium]